MSFGGLGQLGQYGSYHGNYRIRSRVYRLNVPGVYLVILFERLSCAQVSRTLSDIDGYYEFRNIAYILNGYFTVAFDNTLGDLRNAGISDLLTPEIQQL